MKSKSVKRSPAGRGSLIVVAGLLIGSALLRLGDGAGQALARGPDEIVTDGIETTPIGQACKTPKDLEAMLTAFSEREERIASREVALKDRMHALQIADEAVTRKLTELSEAEEQLRATIALAETAAEDDLDRLTRVYENMKPKQAAALFEEMDPNFAAGFLARMRPESAAAVMAGLSPEAAHLFSVVLAGRNADVPRE